MFGRKANKTPEQTPARRQVHRGGVSPAFSYYTSRVSEKPVERAPEKRTTEKREQRDTEKEIGRSSRSLLAGLPFWLLLIIIVVCAGKILTLSTDPKIVIVGRTAASSSYVRSAATYEAAARKLLAGSITNRVKLTVDAQGVSQALKREFPELEDVSVSVPLINSRPLIYVQPADPSLVLQATQGNYALNRSGLVLAVLQSLPSGIPVVVDQSGLTPRPGRQLLPSSTVGFAQTVAYQLNAAHLVASAFVLPANSPYELDARLEGKPYMIRFNLEADALTQCGAAIATIQQLSGVNPSSYVDVRVPGKVYYK
jgi:hypothetical protein